MQLPSASGLFSNKTTFGKLSWPAAPLTRGLPLGVTVFAYPDNFVTKRKILHTTTSAKTRATAMLRPPTNIRIHQEPLNNSLKKLFYDKKLLNLNIYEF